MQAFETPAIGHKTASEQIGMTRRLAKFAEIAGRGDQPAAEIVLPNAIDDDPRRQRVFRVGEPPGQRGAAAGRLQCGRRSLNLCRLWIEDRQNTGGNVFFVTLARDDRRRSNGAHIAHRVRDGLQGRWLFCVELGRFGMQLLPPLSLLAFQPLGHRFFKQILGCRHLFFHNENGIKRQAYCAIIASMLICLWTGRKPNKRTYEMICYYFLGLASEQELRDHLGELPAQEFPYNTAKVA